MVVASNEFTAGFAVAGVADAYDDILVPRLFTPSTVILLARLGLRPSETLLDVACGTGIVVRMAAPVLGPTGRVIGRDLNEAMLERARRHRLPPDSATVEFGVSPAAPLDLGDGSVDTVTCQQGLQFFPDPDAAVAEMRRCLRPRGRVAIAVWRHIDECPLWAALEVGLAGYIGTERASGIRQPFSWPGEDALVAVMNKAGFSDVVVASHTVVMHFAGGVRQAVRVLDATPYAADIAVLDAAKLEHFTQTVTGALGRSRSPDEAVDIPARTLLATAVRA